MSAGLILIAAYLLGSVPTGYVLGLLAGVDIRRTGSGNIGATNVARVLGKWQGALTLVVDAAKGFVPAWVALRLGLGPGLAAVAGATAFLGHLYPVFLRFKGGKGVATALGVLVALAPSATLILIGIFAAVMLSSRFVSLSAITAALAAPLVLWFLGYRGPLVALGLFFAVLIPLRHHDNIRRLLARTEPKFRT